MSHPIEPIQIPLTKEQQELIRQHSGQSAETLEVVPDPADSGPGRGLQFNWRLSVDTGIPGQQRRTDQAESGGSPDGTTPDTGSST
jgi:hypothetical protein